jgi:hypothetical protein
MVKCLQAEADWQRVEHLADLVLTAYPPGDYTEVEHWVREEHLAQYFHAAVTDALGDDHPHDSLFYQARAVRAVMKPTR